MAGPVSIEDQGGVAVVRIDRPPANAMNLELLEAGHRVLGELAAAEPGAVVLTGREGFFSAGVDLKLAPTLDRDGQRAMVGRINALFAGWYGFPRPVVCAVNGHAIAGGLILALCGDYRVGATEGRYGLTELRAGMPYPAVAMATVKAELNTAARVLVLRAELADSRAMLDAGAFDELAEPDAVLPRALAVAEKLAALPREGYALIKDQLRGETVARMRALEESDPLLRGWTSVETADAAAGVLAAER